MSKTITQVLPLSALLLLAGGTAWAQPGATLPGEATATKAPQRAVCAVCGVREKAGPEPVAATLIHEGKSYYFCTEKCRDEFQQDPDRWTTAAQMPDGREGVTRPPASQEHDHAPGGVGPAGGAGGGSAAPS